MKTHRPPFTHHIARVACGLTIALACSQGSAHADELFTVSQTSLIQRGSPFTANFIVAGACGGAAQSSTFSGTDLMVGDVLGRIYVYASNTQTLTYAYDAPLGNDARSLATHNGNLLIGGDGTIARVQTLTGVQISTLTAPIPVEAMVVIGNDLYIAGSFGQVLKGDANSGNFQNFGVCGGAVNSMVVNGGSAFLGTTSVVYEISLSTGGILNSFSVPSDATALLMHKGDLLVGGSDQKIYRVDRNTGALKSTLITLGSIDAMSMINDVDPGSEYCFGTLSCPCGNNDTSGGCKNSSGFGGRIVGGGAASVNSDELVLSAFQLPKNKSGRFYMAGLQAQVPFGDGFLCTGTSGYPIFRFPVQSSGSTGAFEISDVVAYSLANFPATGHITAGSTWNFQAWIRDPQGPCGATFNTSNAYSVTFVP